MTAKLNRWASKWLERLHAGGTKPGQRLREWADLLAKLSAPAVVILGALLAHKFQESMTMATLLNQREQSDTSIRAEMFKAITDRLLGDKGGKLAPGRQAVFAELLALNFHEHIELKPLMQELDLELSRRLARADTPEQRETYRVKLGELQSVARRVRARQTALLYHPDENRRKPILTFASWAPSWVPWLGAKPSERGEKGLLRMISVRFEGPRYSADSPANTRCDFDEDVKPGEPEGRNVCSKDLLIEPAPHSKLALTISIDRADWERQSFTLSVKPGLAEEPSGEGDSKPIDAALDACGSPSRKHRALAPLGKDKNVATGGSSVQFETTWYDFPLTDNTQLADGSRYAVFIDDVCPERKTVKFGLLWFPIDYFPARERPTNYRDLRTKLGLDDRPH